MDRATHIQTGTAKAKGGFFTVLFNIAFVLAALAMVSLPAWHAFSADRAAEKARKLPPELTLAEKAIVKASLSKIPSKSLMTGLFSGKINYSPIDNGYKSIHADFFIDVDAGRIEKALLYRGKRYSGSARFYIEGATLQYELDSLQGDRILFPEIGEAISAISANEIILEGGKGQFLLVKKR